MDVVVAFIDQTRGCDAWRVSTECVGKAGTDAVAASIVVGTRRVPLWTAHGVCLLLVPRNRFSFFRSDLEGSPEYSHLYLGVKPPRIAR